ncbi:ABC transporter permease [Caldisericum exile]|uniref:Oligopeptide ABC transporter permease protein n=1 Tax=Caldisericum exile (strain DSM 21853 / NBRC 104410 / AZM16c01) TaxID=511051 RepID=A0A7U6GDN4_CALEA|nr:ABC transporter permease [Caldisericum exile]BAL80425.1 putative oligopeptide ABC transporter permease protein [Caldisericum exile AZM16c01]
MDIEVRKEVVKKETSTYWNKVFERLKKDKLAMISLFFLILIFVFVIFGPIFYRVDPNYINLNEVLQPPSRLHLLGTDENGRDELARLMYGGRISLLISFAVTLTSGLIGAFIGIFAAYKKGFVDLTLMRINEIMMTIPEFPILVVAAKIRIVPSSILKLIIILVIFGWVGIARIVRGEALSVSEEQYVEAAKAIGVSDTGIIFKHILPNTFHVLIVWSTLRLGGVILSEAALSFFGLGVQPPAASWGNMLMNAQTYIWTAQWLVVFPGLMIFLVVLLFNFIGDGLRNAMDPKFFR